MSLLLHAALLGGALVGAPLVGRLLGVSPGAIPPGMQVVTFRMDDILADVSAASAVDAAPDTPIQGPLNSQAADRVPGEADRPVPAGGEVALDNSIPGTSSAAERGAAAEEAGAGAETAEPPDDAMPVAEPDLTPARERHVALRERLDASPSALLTGKQPPSEGPGHGAQRQAELGEAGALAFGDYAFSTRAWDYEPYWYSMRRKLYAAWHPPAAYTAGLLKSGGWTVVRATIERDGTLSKAEVVEAPARYHESLHRASLAAMQGAAPFRPLPADFPDEHLVVTVRFVYLPAGVPAAAGRIP